MKKFVLVLGGSGVGKNFYINKHFPQPTTTIIDLDQIKNQYGANNAIGLLKDILEENFKKGLPLIVHPSVGKNPTANINKLKLAKKYGYITKIVYLHGTPEQGIINVKKRVDLGGHDVPVEKIKDSYEKSFASFLITTQSGGNFIDEIIEKFLTEKETFAKFFNKKHSLLNESQDMLDISIENIDKAGSKILSLINVPVVITEKTDGVKITVIRNNEPYDRNWENNWIVSYKGSVIHSEDFYGIKAEDDPTIKSHSIGISQFKFIFDVLKKAHQQQEIKQIPLNTELFFEFLIKKPTLTREYKQYHNLILLAISPTTYKEEFGKLISSPKSFDTSTREEFANLLGVSIPRVLFKGTLSELIESTNPKEIITALKNKFLNIESVYGGLMEGVVLEFENGVFLKILQPDQHDKDIRKSIKQKFAPNDPDQYYKKIRSLALQILKEISPILNIKDSLKKLSVWIYSDHNKNEFLNLDANKSLINAKDDTFLTAKMLLLRKLPGNNNALFLGRMSPLTVAHYKIIDNALKIYDHVVINLVKAKTDSSNPFPLDIQIEMLRKCFGDRIEITTSETGNLIRVLQKPSKTINVVLAGTDRFENYKQQLEHTPDVTVVEIPRVDEVSGTKVRKALLLNDLNDFKQNTPSQLWGMFETLRKFVISSR